MPASENGQIKNESPLDLTGRQITYDREELRGEFARHLDQLFARLESKEVADLLGADFSEKVRNAREQLEKRLEGKFRVVVMGDFKRGKSTLVNALLETTIAPMNVTPETLTINEIAYGEKLEAQMCLAGGGRIALAPEEISSDALAPIVEQLAEKEKTVTHLEIKAPVEWLKNARLVDTPGLGDVLGSFDALVQAYLNQADAIVYLISAVSPLSQTETDFLRLSIEPQEFPKIIFVVNMLDLAQTSENVERISLHVSRQLNALFPNAQIYGLSAFDEICRIDGNARPNALLAPLLEENFRQFRETLQNSVVLDRDLIQLDRAGDLLRFNLADFSRSVSLLAAALNREQSELSASVAESSEKDAQLSARVAAAKENFQNEIAKLGEQTVGWLDEFFDRLEQEIVRDLPKFQFDEIQRNFHFFLADALREAAAQCDTAHREAILQAATEASRTISGEMRIASALNLDGEMFFTGAQAEWSKIETFGAAVSFLPSVGVFLELGSKVLFKGAEESKKLQNYCKQLENLLPEMRLKTAEKVRAGYKTIADALQTEMEDAFKRQKATTTAAVEQARALQKTGQTQTENAAKTLDELKRLFDESGKFVESLTEKLWAQTKTLRLEANPSAN